MKFGKLIIAMGLLLSSQLFAQDDNGEENGDEGKAEDAVETAPAESSQNLADVLSGWEKAHAKIRTSLPKRWLFLQEQAGAYGAPSPLNVDKYAFDSFGWFQLAEAEAIRLYIQVNPSEKKDVLKPEELPARLKRYASLSGADGIILKTAGENTSWSIYQVKKNMSTPIASFAKGPESFRQDVPVSWLLSQLNYDAMVVGTEGDYLVLAKLRPLKRGAQGLILKKSATAVVADVEKDVGALLRIVYDSDDYILAKVSLSKSGRPKVPVGSKVLFDQP